jgi:hypothetical protein
VSAYPKLGPIATVAVKLEQSPREDKPKASHIPDFLKGAPQWKS